MTHPFDQLEKYCDRHDRQKVIVSRDTAAGATVITLECPECERVETMPAIIEWLNSQDVLGYSQFTIDWVEGTTGDYEMMMAEEGTLPDDNEVYGAIRYEVENILQVLNPRLLDVEFFKRALAEVSK